IFAQEISKWPVVLGFFLGGKTDKAGVLPLPAYRTKELFGKYQVMHIVATGYSGNIPLLQKNAAAAGHLYPQLDTDGVTRRVPMFVRYEDGLYPALSLAMVQTYLGNAPLKLK